MFKPLGCKLPMPNMIFFIRFAYFQTHIGRTTSYLLGKSIAKWYEHWILKISSNPHSWCSPAMYTVLLALSAWRPLPIWFHVSSTNFYPTHFHTNIYWKSFILPFCPETRFGTDMWSYTFCLHRCWLILSFLRCVFYVIWYVEIFYCAEK